MGATVQKESTILDDGRLELSGDELSALGVGPGDGVVKVTTDQGILIMTPRRYIDWVFDQVGEALPDSVALDELIEAGRETRGELIAERSAQRPSG